MDVDSDDFSTVGVGDMSGDVFGNGMLLSRHIKLVAAFDHRHVFLDPDPDPEASYAERRRLFELPRSSWADYDQALLSAGGGVFPRSVKSIQLTPQVRAVLGLPDTETAMSPDGLIAAILSAPVDLLWNGGIGTYVKASNQSNADVGDRSNDAVRVDASQVRAKVIGEGGNLGLTQEARVEYALAGGLVNTDFIDNSAGVDTSDHEVNIKILLDSVVRDGEMTRADRNALLHEMTDEVAEQVLEHNYQQNRTLAAARAQAAQMLHVHARYIRKLERDGRIRRRLDVLPTDRDIAERRSSGRGLARPSSPCCSRTPRSPPRRRCWPPTCPMTHTCGRCSTEYFPTPLREQVRRPDGQSPAAPGDHHHRRRQRHGGPVGHHVRLPAERGDRRVGAARSPRPGWSPGRSSTCRASGSSCEALDGVVDTSVQILACSRAAS